MNKISPVFTEKTMKLAGMRRYTFEVGKNMTKFDIKKLVEEIFSVHVTDIKTMNSKAEIKKTNSGRKKTVKPIKKAIITLKDKEEIDLFTEEKKGKKSK